MGYLEEAIRKIEEQQPKAHTTVWGVGEQLKDLLRAEPGLAELVCQDLENKSMSIAACERKIKARADEIHAGARGGSVCVTPMEAEGIIRAFYGLPELPGASPRPTGEGGMPGASPRPTGAGTRAAEVIDLADFF